MSCFHYFIMFIIIQSCQVPTVTSAYDQNYILLAPLYVNITMAMAFFPAFNDVFELV